MLAMMFIRAERYDQAAPTQHVPRELSSASLCSAFSITFQVRLTDVCNFSDPGAVVYCWIKVFAFCVASLVIISLLVSNRRFGDREVYLGDSPALSKLRIDACFLASTLLFPSWVRDPHV